MFYPEELDNKTFRLFVQRTWYLLNNNLVLSSTERQLADLIAWHPEATKSFSRKMLDIAAAFASDNENPYLYLAGLWEIYKQILADKPKGIKSVFEAGFPEGMSQRERRRRMARAFILLCKKGEHMVSDLKYIRDLEKTVHAEIDSAEEEAVQERANAPRNRYIQEIIEHSLFSVKKEFQADASSKPIKTTMKLKAALSKLPTEWIDGMARGWERTEKPTRKEREQDLLEFLQSEECYLQLTAVLQDAERAAIKMVLDNGGYILYGKLSKAFGEEIADNYWWSEHPPQSVIGRLRYLGMLYVGKAPVKSRILKVAVIPKELQPLLAGL
jgi:hypothetical protein